MNSSAPAIPELLAPAGSFEKLATAIHYGADAVYLSGKKFGLRAKAANFDEQGISQAVDYAHQRGVKVYVTVNIIAHHDDFQGLDRYLHILGEAGVDAIIVSDPGILQVARSLVPALPIHLSTQANVTNSRAASFWVEQGVARLNLARELNLAEIAAICEQVRAEIEVFAHGALCISYSGRCLLSTYMTGRDANRGECAHPCRYSYALVEEKRPGEYFPVYEDERGTYIFNAKDLCLLNSLPELLAAGVSSLKIEGRMKSIFYVGGVVRVYRAALDYLRQIDPALWSRPQNIEMPAPFLEEIEKTGTRGMSLNFAHQKPGPGDMLYDSSRVDQGYEPVAVVRGNSRAEVEVELRNVCRQGEAVEYMGPGIEVRRFQVAAMREADGSEVSRGNPGDRLYWQLREPGGDFLVNAIFRRKKS
ncbi:MAG: U32 family peptidase [Desulfofustis sp.]|jgi:U32 family peptidase